MGKTFTALAVIKYYENRNLRVLVLCPKKLSDNWMTYKANYVNNPIAGDRLRYHPEELTQTMLGGMVSNIKSDRSDLDLLYACLLDWGVEINLPHSAETLDGCTIHNVDDGALVACFNENVPDTVIRRMADLHPLRAVFRDSSFASDDSKINVTEIFKNLSPDTNVKVI